MTKTCEVIIIDALDEYNHIVSHGHIVFNGKEIITLDEPKIEYGYLYIRKLTAKQLAVTTDLVN